MYSDPTPQALGQELPALIKDGYTSFKIYMTYDALKLSDYQILDILALARREGALVMVHAENHDIIQWLAQHLVDQSHVAPKFHAVAHARIAEAEATNRAISLARLVDAPMLIVHMSEIEAIETLRQAQRKGLKIFGETCPQYIARPPTTWTSHVSRGPCGAAARRRGIRRRRRRCGQR